LKDDIPISYARAGQSCWRQSSALKNLHLLQIFLVWALLKFLSKYDAQQSHAVMALYDAVANFKLLVEFIQGEDGKDFLLQGLSGGTSHLTILVFSSLEKRD
jgi:hypothetical protein